MAKALAKMSAESNDPTPPGWYSKLSRKPLEYQSCQHHSAIRSGFGKYLLNGSLPDFIFDLVPNGDPHNTNTDKLP